MVYQNGALWDWTEVQSHGGAEAYREAVRNGPLVKRLRRRPLTPQTGVRFPHGSPIKEDWRQGGEGMATKGEDAKAFLIYVSACQW